MRRLPDAIERDLQEISDRHHAIGVARMLEAAITGAADFIRFWNSRPRPGWTLHVETLSDGRQVPYVLQS